jgi:hypothetical protein
LFGKTVQLFPGYEGDGTAKARLNVIARLRKKLRNYVFDGAVHGRRKRRAVGELLFCDFFLLALPIPIFCILLTHVSELSGDKYDNVDFIDDDVVDELGGDNTIMQDHQAASSKKKAAASAKKPTAGKPDPTAAINSTLAAGSLQQQQKCIRYNLSIGFPFLVSPTGYFRDGQRHICVDFLGISIPFENNYMVETSGKTLKLFMKVPQNSLI